MKIQVKFLATIIFVVAAFIGGCTEDTPTVETLNLNITGLEDLGDDYAYEGWLIVDGAPVSAGIFSVDASGNLSETAFEIDAANLENASTYILTIEPSPDSDPNPSDVHILAGDFSSNSADLSTKHSAALGTDFADASGIYILATPTDGANDTDENSGIWWLDPTAGPGPGLEIPSLPAGWKYEGWAVVDGTPVSTGRFTSATGSDDAAPYSGSEDGPAFPGEDLLMNAPGGLNFPTDLAGMTVVISVEPDPDNSPAPFLLKPLVGNVDANATDHTPYNMNNNAGATNPNGSVSR